MTARPGRGRWLALIAFAVVVTLPTPATAWAADDPPDIVGFTVDQAEQALLTWNKSVVITYVPSLKELPAGFTRDTVLVASGRLFPSTTVPGSVANGPQVEVRLGTTLPDLTGLTPAAAAEKLSPLQLKAATLPEDAQPDWVVQLQRPQAGTVVAFGSVVSVRLTPPSPPNVATTPPAVTASPQIIVEPPRRSVDPVLVASVAGGSAIVLVAAGLVTSQSLRRRRRRRLRPTERVEAHGYAGQVVGPNIVAPTPGVSVRLEPHHDSSDTTLLEEAEWRA